MSGGVPGLGMQRPKAPTHPALPPALANYLASHPLNAELLARPEAEQLLMGLNSGNITVENIVQQLSNPALQVRVVRCCVDDECFYSSKGRETYCCRFLN